MRAIAIVILAVAMIHPNVSAESESGTVCIAPWSGKSFGYTAPDIGVYCKSGAVSLRIDMQPKMPWPTDSTMRISGLNITERHRVVVLCDGKPQQSFAFRFSENRMVANRLVRVRVPNLCLFVGGAYILQLWDVKRSPWCKCNGGSPK